MKLIASSQVPSHMPYLHLAYIVAHAKDAPMTQQAASPFATVGLLFFALALFGKWLGKKAIGPVLFWCGMIGGISCLLLAANGAYFSEDRVRSQRRRITLARMAVLSSGHHCAIAVDKLPQADGDYPATNYIVLTDDLWEGTPMFDDGWGNEILLKVETGNYSLRSAGEDGVLGTKDDSSDLMSLNVVIEELKHEKEGIE